MVLDHARQKVRNIIDSFRPTNYENICEAVGIGEDTIKVVEEEEKKVV